MNAKCSSVKAWRVFVVLHRPVVWAHVAGAGVGGHVLGGGRPHARVHRPRPRPAPVAGLVVVEVRRPPRRGPRPAAAELLVHLAGGGVVGDGLLGGLHAGHLLLLLGAQLAALGLVLAAPCTQ